MQYFSALSDSFLSMLALAMGEIHLAVSHKMLQTGWDEVQEGPVYCDTQETRQLSLSPKNFESIKCFK